MESLLKIEGLCKPIMKELKDNYHPHISVVITSDGIRVEESVFGVPNKTKEEVCNHTTPLKQDEKITMEEKRNMSYDELREYLNKNEEPLYLLYEQLVRLSEIARGDLTVEQQIGISEAMYRVVSCIGL